MFAGNMEFGAVQGPETELHVVFQLRCPWFWIKGTKGFGGKQRMITKRTRSGRFCVKLPIIMQ